MATGSLIKPWFGKSKAAGLRRLWSLYRKAVLAAARPVLSATPFTIVSNNCWGAHIYRELRLPYSTPFVGLFVPPGCYLELLRNFDSLIRGDLSFIRASKYQRVNEFRASRCLDYPIALLADRVEIHFMHYKSREECLSKWRRRVARIVEPSSKCLFKFCDHDGATIDELRAFDELPMSRKVCFVGSPHLALSCGTFVPSCPDGRVPDGGELASVSARHFNALRWIAGGGIRSALLPPGVL